MVPLEGDGLNSLFDALEDREHQLKKEGIDFDQLEP